MLMLLTPNTFFIDVNTVFATEIRLFTSFSHLPSDVNTLPMYTKEFTCSRGLPRTLISHVGMDDDLLNTMVQDLSMFTLLYHNVHQSLQFMFCFCKYYCIVCIIMIVDHPANYSEASFVFKSLSFQCTLQTNEETLHILDGHLT